jgi:hypothetical protein
MEAKMPPESAIRVSEHSSVSPDWLIVSPILKTTGWSPEATEAGILHVHLDSEGSLLTAVHSKSGSSV